MFLMNRFAHKRNTDVKVGHTIYRIGPGGFICDPEDPKKPLDVPDVDAQKLVQGKAWSPLDWDPTDPKSAFRFGVTEYPKPIGKGRPPRTMAQMKADYGLSDDVGKPLSRRELGSQAVGTATSRDGTGGLSDVETAVPSDRDIRKSVHTDEKEQSADMAHQKTLGIQPEEFSEVSLVGEAEVGDGRKAVANEPEVASYPEHPAEGQHWPDPEPGMDIEYLRAMADAYNVRYTKNARAKTLSERIHKAMYE